MVEEEVNSNLIEAAPSVPDAPVLPPKPSKRKWIVLGLVFFALILLAAGNFLFMRDKNSGSQNNSNETEQENNKQTQTDPNTIRMLATGDFIAHDAINLRAKQTDGTYDYAPMLKGFKQMFAASDINFCNQATLAGGEKFGITGYPTFNAPLEWIRDMRGLGCNVINVGTNHTNDKGQGAINAELEEWDKQDVLAVAGANRSTEELNKVRYFEVKGVKFAFVSYTTYSNAPNPNPYSLTRYIDKLVSDQLSEAEKNADITIVSMRWGTEYSEAINGAQDSQSKALAALGADIILGHGTHTLQPVKQLQDDYGNKTVVWYGLGNFLNAQLETTGLTGCVAQINIDVATKKVTGSMCLPFYMHYEWTAEQKKKEDLLARSNFQILPLYRAEELISKSQLNTTVQEQMQRINAIVSSSDEVPVQNAEDL